MSINPHVTEDMINLGKIAEQQNDQRALKNNNRNLKQTHDIKLAGSLSPISKKVDEVNETTKQLGELVTKSHVEDGNTQTPAIQNIIGAQSLRDTLTLMKRSELFSIYKKN